MTKLLYQQDSYLQAFDATITAVDNKNHGVILDQTVFYPGGGGQPADQGTLTADKIVHPISRARKISGEIVHLVTGDGPLPEPGTPTHGRINWEHRYRLMRTHTAMHTSCVVSFFAITVLQ